MHPAPPAQLHRAVHLGFQRDSLLKTFTHRGFNIVLQYPISHDQEPARCPAAGAAATREPNGSCEREPEAWEFLSSSIIQLGPVPCQLAGPDCVDTTDTCDPHFDIRAMTETPYLLLHIRSPPRARASPEGSPDTRRG